jgi:hypothetical protein
MAWLEIIEIRAVGSNRELLSSQLQDLINDVIKETDLQDCRIYRHVMLETDFSIHIFHNSDEAGTSCSSVCTRLVSSLKDFGLVNHTSWVEKFYRVDRNETKRS